MQKISTLKKLLLVGAVLGFASAEASVLHIKNENRGELELVVEPGTGSMRSSKQLTKRILKAGESAVVEVGRNDFPDTESFSVVGKVKMPSLYNKCGPLLKSTNYKIVFVETATNATACYSEAEN